MTSGQISNEEQDEVMREDMVMDARRDKELEIAGAGGYYRHIQQGLAGFVDAAELLVDEGDLEEDGLVASFVQGAAPYDVLRQLAHGSETADAWTG